MNGTEARELARSLLAKHGWEAERVHGGSFIGGHSFYLNDTRYRWQGYFSVDIPTFDALPTASPAMLAQAVADLADSLRTGAERIEGNRSLALGVAVFVKSTASYQALRAQHAGRFHCIVNIYPGKARPIFITDDATLLTRSEVEQYGAEIEASDRSRNPAFFR